MSDILKIAAGVFLALVAFWLLTSIVVRTGASEEDAARDLLERQFAPAH